MNKYWNLIKNVVVLGVGSFTSKLLSVVMLPFYTHVLSEEEYGIADLVVNTANLLIPLVSLSIAEAVVRFALESKSYRKDAAFQSEYSRYLAVLPYYCCATR